MRDVHFSQSSKTLALRSLQIVQHTIIARDQAPFALADDDDGPDRPLNQSMRGKSCDQLHGWKSGHMRPNWTSPTRVDM
jgi:hypothetical protein